jgi:hypothetical protein
MSDRNSNKKRFIKNHIRYSQNKMTGEERNSFEKELQKDPFAEESEEGLSQLTAESLQEDISILQKRLDKKISHRLPTVFYRIAAAVAVLIVVSAIFFVSRDKNNVVTFSENMIQETDIPFSIQKPEPITGPVINSNDAVQKAPLPDQQKSKSDEKIATAVAEEQPVAAEQPFAVEQSAGDEQVAASGQAARKDSEAPESDIVTVANSDAEMKSVALESRTAMARAVAVPETAKSKSLSDYQAPQPIINKDSFNLYLEKNIRNPESYVSGQLVVIAFKVRTDSTITGIRIVTSPGQSWSDEAIRLIKEGPAWKPAVENGQTIEDEVSVTIVFR